MNIYVFDLKIVLCALERLCGALLGYFILALKKLRGSSLGAANGSLRAHNHLTDSMDRNFGALKDLLEALLVAFWELLQISLRLSWSPLGVQETSRASKSDAKSLSDANLSSHLAFGASQINDFHLFFNGFMNICVFDLKLVL